MSRKNLNGVHIPHRKNTAGMQAIKMPPPATVTIPMSMHIGKPANCIVAVGDHVNVGQMIGEPGGFVSSPVFASVSGTVKKIVPMLQFMGATCQAVVIESDGQMTVADTVKAPEITDYASFINAVRDSGVVGLGGATFPTAVKLDVKDTSRIQEIIINGAECEGYITSDHRTMLDRTDEVVEGCRLLEKWLDVKKIIIAIEDNKPDCIEKMKAAAANDEHVEVRALPCMYPQGGEKVLIYHTTGKIMPEGKLPIDVGSVVMNVTSVATLAHYCTTGMPLVEKCITGDGSAIKEPKNLLVPIGTPYRYLVEAAGGLKCEPGRVVNGGPMMGHAVPSLDYPVLKTTSSVLVFSEADSVIHEPTPCIHCGRCVSHCPMNLNPTAFSDDLEEENGDKRALLLDRDHVNFCIECGSCSYVCPAHRPLVENNRAAKKYLKKYKADHAEGGKK